MKMSNMLVGTLREVPAEAETLKNMGNETQKLHEMEYGKKH